MNKETYKEPVVKCYEFDLRHALLESSNGETEVTSEDAGWDFYS